MEHEGARQSRTLGRTTTIVIGILGLLLALGQMSLNFSKEARNRSQRVEQLLLWSWDILGGQEGSTGITTVERDPARLEVARRHLAEAIRLDPTNAGAYRQMGVYYIAQGDFHRAGQALAAAVELQPEGSTIHNHLGVLYYLQKRYPEAVAEFNRALELEPSYVEAYVNLGNALSDDGKISAGLASYKAAIDLDPSNSTIYYNAATALGENGAFEASEQISRLAIRVGQEDEQVYTTLGNALQLQGKFEEANDSYLKAISLAPRSAAAFYNLGTLRRAQGEHRESIELFRKALALPIPKEPTSLEVHAASALNLGLEYARIGEDESAVKYLREAILQDPTEKAAYEELRKVLLRLGREEEANEVHEVPPSTPE